MHLYKNILKVHCGRTHSETEIVLQTLLQILIHQRRRITQTRMIAFVKRISTLALQSQHNAILGTLGIIKQVMQLGKAAHVLLDTDCTGDGHYQGEIEEPDYCNAHCTALYELVALQVLKCDNTFLFDNDGTTDDTIIVLTASLSQCSTATR